MRDGTPVTVDASPAVPDLEPASPAKFEASPWAKKRERSDCSPPRTSVSRTATGLGPLDYRCRDPSKLLRMFATAVRLALPFNRLATVHRRFPRRLPGPCCAVIVRWMVLV